MLLSVKENESLGPLDIRIFRSDAVVTRPEHRAHAVEESHPFHRSCRGSLGAAALSKVLHPVEQSCSMDSSEIQKRIDADNAPRYRWTLAVDDERHLLCGGRRRPRRDRFPRGAATFGGAACAAPRLSSFALARARSSAFLARIAAMRSWIGISSRSAGRCL